MVIQRFELRVTPRAPGVGAHRHVKRTIDDIEKVRPHYVWMAGHFMPCLDEFRGTGVSKVARSDRLQPYYFYVQEDLIKFWERFGTERRKVLFVFGVGFDPRCIPGLRGVASLFHQSSLHTLCVRFTDIFDRFREENELYTKKCLETIHSITEGLSGKQFWHNEIEVRLFSSAREMSGDGELLSQFTEIFEDKLSQYTDVIVDISAMPRPLMDALIAYLWTKRPSRQNLFAMLTEVNIQADIQESDYTKPSYMFGGRKPAAQENVLWIPVLGGRIQRFQHIHDFLQPKDVFPIIPFPTSDPRSGDEIVLRAKDSLAKWDVPFSNIMYASGSVPFDVFRKIQDLIHDYSSFRPDLSVVVSALSGRSLSLGVVLAALWSDLAICHSQPTTYAIMFLAIKRTLLRF